MDIRTVKDRVIIKAEFVETLSSSGIFLGEGEMKYEGVVLAAGPDVQSVSVGDRVLFAEGAGQRTQFNRDRVLVVREDDLLGLIGE